MVYVIQVLNLIASIPLCICDKFLQLLHVCCVKTVQFNKFVTRTQRDGNSPITDQIVGPL